MALHSERGYILSDYADADYEWSADFKLSDNAIAFLFGQLRDYTPEPHEAGLVARLLAELHAAAITRGMASKDGASA